MLYDPHGARASWLLYIPVLPPRSQFYSVSLIMPAYRRRTRRYGRRAARPARRTTRVTRRSRPRRRPRMSRRAVLNITSTKKQDNQLNVDATGAVLPNGLTTPAVGGFFIFSPTYRFLEADANGAIKGTSSRTSPDTFAVGFKETINFTVVGTSPVRWRRIMFSTKSVLFSNSFYSLPVLGLGQTRGRPLNTLASAPEFLLLTDFIFKGTQNQDWTNIFDAKIDTQRITLHRDVAMVVNPGNQAGSTRILKSWLPLRKRFLYGDDESGDAEQSLPSSANTTSGLGNVFIVDFMEPAIAGTGTLINFNPQSTYYWHER